MEEPKKSPDVTNRRRAIVPLKERKALEAQAKLKDSPAGREIQKVEARLARLEANAATKAEYPLALQGGNLTLDPKGIKGVGVANAAANGSLVIAVLANGGLANVYFPGARVI